MSKKQKIKVVDLFSGAGGLSLAAKKAGGEIVFAIESDKYAADTYRHNFCGPLKNSGTVLYEKNILDISPTELKFKHFPSSKNCDILLGGPPCQGFSSHRINDAGVGDPRNTLIYNYFNFIEALRPRAFLMENVPGLLWPRHAEYLERFYELSTEAGYQTFAPIKIDAKDYGVPQTRKRVFVLGVQKSIDTGDISWPPKPSHASKSDANGTKKWNSCGHVFSESLENDPNSLHMNHSPELVEVFRNTPANGGSRKDSGRILPCHIDHDGHNDVYGRVDPNRPAPTMTTACINPSKGRFVHPTKNHGITIRQAARIQTVPDDFIFRGGLIAAGKQIGNAVPVLLGEHLIKTISKMLQSNNLSLHSSFNGKNKEPI